MTLQSDGVTDLVITLQVTGQVIIPPVTDLVITQVTGKVITQVRGLVIILQVKDQVIILQGTDQVITHGDRGRVIIPDGDLLMMNMGLWIHLALCYFHLWKIITECGEIQSIV